MLRGRIAAKFNGFLASRTNSLRYRHNRRAKVHPRCLQLRVFIAQMPIHLADENPAVLVAHPAGNRHVINPAHHGVADKMVSAVMEAKFLQVIGQDLLFVFKRLP